MARPKGIDHFLKYLTGLEDQYVLIGGGAAAILMEEQNLEFRKTVDVDLVLLTNGSTELNARIGKYVQDGQFEKKEAIPDTQFKQITKEYGTFVKKDLLLLIRKVFSV